MVSALLAFMAVTGYAGMLNIKGLTPELIPPPEIYAGTPAVFQLRITNAKRLFPSFLIRVDSADCRGAVLPLVPHLAAREARMTFEFSRRGTVLPASLRLSSSFPVNFFTRFWVFRLQQELVVFPRLVPLAEGGDGDFAERSGGCLRHERGTDGELERISSYSGREPLKQIHWKLSARGEELLVKGFGRHSAAPLLIDPDGLPGRDLEERVSQAAWLVRRWVMERPVGLAGRSTHIPAESGRQHELRLLTELAHYGLD